VQKLSRYGKEAGVYFNTDPRKTVKTMIAIIDNMVSFLVTLTTGVLSSSAGLWLQ
jgi:hypothetical protein